MYICFQKKSQDTSLSEVLCKLILIVFILFVLYLCIYCDYCVYHYKSSELVSLYTLDNGLIYKYYYYISSIFTVSVIEVWC